MKQESCRAPPDAPCVHKATFRDVDRFINSANSCTTALLIDKVKKFEKARGYSETNSEVAASLSPTWRLEVERKSKRSDSEACRVDSVPNERERRLSDVNTTCWTRIQTRSLPEGGQEMFHDDRSLSQRNFIDTSRSQGEQLCSKNPKKLAVEQTVVNNPMDVWREEQCPLYNSLGQPRCNLDSHTQFGESVSVKYQQVHQTRDPNACSYKRHTNQADQLSDHRQWKPPVPAMPRPSGPQLSKCCVSCDAVSHRCLSVCTETHFSNNQTRADWLTSVGTLQGSSCCQSCGCHSVGRDAHVKSFGTYSSGANTSASVANKKPYKAGCLGFSDAFVSPSCVQGCEHCSVGIKDKSHVGETEGSMGFPFVQGCDHSTVGVGDGNRSVHLKGRASTLTRDTAFVGGDQITAATAGSFVEAEAPWQSSPCFQACVTRVLQSDRVDCSETRASPPFRSNPGRGSHVCHARIEAYSPLQADTSLTEPYSPSAFEADEAQSSEYGPPPIDTGVNLSSPEESENAASCNDSKNPYSSSEYETDEFDKAACDAAEMFDALMAYSPTASVNSEADYDDNDDDDVKMADIDGCFVDKEKVRTGEVEVDMEDTPGYLVDKPRAETKGKVNLSAPSSARALLGREETRVRYPQQTQSSLSGDRKIIVSLTQLRKLFGKMCKTDDCLADLSSLEETEIGCVVEFHWKCAAGHQGVWATDERGSDVYGYISGADQSPLFCGLLSLENSWLFSL